MPGLGSSLLEATWLYYTPPLERSSEGGSSQPVMGLSRSLPAWKPEVYSLAKGAQQPVRGYRLLNLHHWDCWKRRAWGHWPWDRAGAKRAGRKRLRESAVKDWGEQYVATLYRVPGLELGVVDRPRFPYQQQVNGAWTPWRRKDWAGSPQKGLYLKGLRARFEGPSKGK